ncbi:MAG: M14 family metallopeptidase [Lachnospiraceae bacterium]
MIDTFCSIELPVHEHLNISKRRIQGNLPGEKRISIVTGTHGDELEGQYVCFLLAQLLEERLDEWGGTVDIYPSLNPLGMDTLTRGVPGFDLDMNRIFPGHPMGSMIEHVASEIIEDILGSDLCVDIHSSNIFLREIPQVRISEDTKDDLLPLAKEINVNFIWIHASATVLQSTLAHSLNTRNVPTLVVEMGVGMRITKEYCLQLVDGIINIMGKLGLWKDANKNMIEPFVADVGSYVEFINAREPGLFIPSAPHWSIVTKGQKIGAILHPLYNKTVEEVIAPCSGMLFTLREYPIVNPGSLLARIYNS